MVSGFHMTVLPPDAHHRAFQAGNFDFYKDYMEPLIA